MIKNLIAVLATYVMLTCYAFGDVMISPQDLIVPDNLSFADKVQKHSEIMIKVSTVYEQAIKNKNEAKSKKSFDDYIAAEGDLENVNKAFAPYAIAQEKYKIFRSEGYMLNDLSGNICLSSETCKTIDPIIAVFYFTGDRKGLGPNLVSPEKDGEVKVSVNGFPLSDFYAFLSDKPLDMITFGILPGVREAILQGDQGEIAKLIRDPIKRPVEIIKDARDNLLGNGDGAKIIKDPINCTVGKLFGRC